MPYKPTGRPPGRPRKYPKPPLFPGWVHPAKRKRAMTRFRLLADRLNPSKALVVLDSRGRPRHKHSPSHSRIA
jgi:hypothetical protein